MRSLALVHVALATRCIRCWGSLWNVVVLYLLMGFRRFSHAVSAIVARAQGRRPRLRRGARSRRGAAASTARAVVSDEIARLAIERGLVDAYRQVFAVLFWFTVLPGPAGAVLYRAAALLAEEWRGDAKGDDTTPIGRERAVFGRAGARAACGCSTGFRCDSPRCRSRSSAISRTRSPAGARRRSSGRTRTAACRSGILLASGGGALGVQLGGPLRDAGRRARRTVPSSAWATPSTPDLLPSGVGLVWRALVLWLLLILLLTLAYVAP